MSREYRHIEQYEKEISELQEQGLTQRQIGERLGFRREQIKEFVRRKREKERKIAAGISIKKKGRPANYNALHQTSSARMAALGLAPTILVFSFPSLKTISVGILITPYFAARAFSSSTFTLPTVMSLLSSAISSTMGETIRQGPHQSA